MFASIKTDPRLIERLEKSAKTPLTKGELLQQRVSFVFGNLPADSTITRDRVAEKIRNNEGA